MTAAAVPASQVARISVIIPIYNVAAHVRACIDSLKAQTFTDFEAVMVDDGSTDGSGDIALQAASDDPRFRLLRQNNTGLSGARNAGLDVASGSYIAFVDSDDQVMPDYLMRLWQVLEETGGDWVACAIQSNAADGTGSRHSAIHGQPDLAHHVAQQRYALNDWSDVIRHFPSAWNKLYRRSLIEGLRFDEGTWFEDHGFFHRAAARTDQIIHLPEVLYIQTRGRAGQITAQDDERVFEQFDVLSAMQHLFESGTRPGGRTALARIASRLVFERSTVLADPERRTRFAQAARDFLQTQGLEYSSDWDTDVGLSWEMEMAGTLPLSVILSWDGANFAALRHSLDALRDQGAPGHEVLIVCQTRAAQRQLETADLTIPAHWQVLKAPRGGEGPGFNHGLDQACGAFVIFVATGDALTPWTLLQRVEAMLRTEAEFGISQMRLEDQDTGQISYHNGIHDMDLWPLGTPPAGPLDLSPMQALSLEAQCSAKIFRRTFLLENELSFTPGPRPDWALCLTAALLARCTTYMPHAAATVQMRDQGFERWHVPHGAHALKRGHLALLETVDHALPTPTTVNLPRGWQRRLFARALREQVYFANETSSAQRRLMLLGAAWTSARLGYGATRTAGLDPTVGHRLAQMMNPLAVIQRSLGKIPVLNTAVTTQPAGMPLTLHAFDLKNHGLIHLQANFHTTPYANIFFRAAGHRQVLFHLSLRHTEGLAVCNDQRADGQWRAERICTVDLSSGRADVTLTFTPPQVSVALNGHEIFRFGARSLRNRGGFARLDQIAGFSVEGTVNTPHVIPQMPQETLMFDSRLSVRVRGADPTARLRALPSGTELSLIPAPGGTATALLPARLWQNLPLDAALTLEFVQGSRQDQLTLTRADIAARIEGLLNLPLAETDSTLCLHMLEHIRHGGLLGQLSTPARGRLNAIAAFYGAQDFVSGPSDPNAPIQDDTPAPLPANDDPIAREIDSALARLSQSQTTPPDQRPDPLAVVTGLHVSHAAQQPLFLALTEVFCTDDHDFAGLHQLAQRRGVLPFDLPNDRWSISAALPYLLADAQYQQISDALNKLAAPGPDWLVTPAIAWAAREALARADTPSEMRTKIFYGFADLLRWRAYDYWDRVHCRELTRTAVALILQGHRLTPLQQHDAAVLCLEVYGLSKQFWAYLENAPNLPAGIARAQLAFGRLMSSETDALSRDGALRVFEAANTVDAPRLRRELFGPLGLPDPNQSRIDIADLMNAQSADANQLSHNVLRHMAYPGCAPVTPEVAQLATTALPTLYPKVPRAPFFDLQRATGQQAMAVLSGQNGTPADMAALTDSLTQLADAGSHHIGLGLALALIDGLHETDPDSASTLCDWIAQQIARLDAATWRAAPALHQPARRLAMRSGLLPRAQALLNQLDLPFAPADAPDNNGLLPGSPLFDTIVTVFSCAPYLDTRIPAMRTGWLSLLDDLGVPYVVIVGDGDGTRRGDIVHLDAPDDYEGLPQKTLAAIKWVHDNTRFGHMLKIDDDCFLNAPLFFQSLSYRKFDYYGRRLHRVPGQMDRVWHQAKSTSDRGRLDLDKSPEPSEYADGGSAYALSRTAMAAALDAAGSPEGQQLINVSFMEDKMLGDLLAMRNIHVAEEDYRISVRRRTYGDAIPVASWLNSFHASQTAPLQLVHLDTHLHQADAAKRLATSGLWPRKIWPSYQDVQLGYQSNALELISSEESVQNARQAEVAVVACMRNEMFMLPHFLAHYRKLGVGAFLIADNCSDDGTLEYLAQQPDVALFSVDTDYKSSRYGVAWQQAMMSAFRVGKWSLVADADELLVWQEKQTQTLPDLLQHPDFDVADAARIFMLDMYPQSPLEQADFASGTPFDQAGFSDHIPFLTNTLSRGPYSSQPCWTSALRHRLIPGSRQNLFVAQKLALLRYQPWMRLSAGLHFVGDVDLAPRELLFAHFKYNADFRRKAQAEVVRGQHFNDAEEYRKYLALASEGRSVIYDAQLSLPWAQVPFVKRRLRP